MKPNLAVRPKAYLYLTLTTAIWGSLYVVTRIALATVPPVTLLFFRYVLAFGALYSLARHGRRSLVLQKEDRKTFVLVGAVGYFLAVGAQVLGTKYAGASVASLVNAANPIFITLFAVWFLHETMTWAKGLAACATLVGAYVILGGAQAPGTAWGVGYSLASVVLWSLTAIVVRHLSTRYDPLVITTWAVGIAALAALPCSAVELAFVPHGELFSGVNILCYLYLGLVCTAVPNLLWNKSLALVEASTCSLFYPVQPLVSVVLGVAVLGESVSVELGVGAVLIVGGLLAAVVVDGRRR